MRMCTRPTTPSSHLASALHAACACTSPGCVRAAAQPQVGAIMASRSAVCFELQDAPAVPGLTAPAGHASKLQGVPSELWVPVWLRLQVRSCGGPGAGLPMVPSRSEKVRAAQQRCRSLLAEVESRLPILPISASLQVRLHWLFVHAAVVGRRARAPAAPSTSHACLTARLPVSVLREWVLTAQIGAAFEGWSSNTASCFEVSSHLRFCWWCGAQVGAAAGAGAQPQPGQISCMIYRGVEPGTGMSLYALPPTGGESACMAALHCHLYLRPSSWRAVGCVRTRTEHDILLFCCCRCCYLGTVLPCESDQKHDIIRRSSSDREARRCSESGTLRLLLSLAWRQADWGWRHCWCRSRSRNSSSRAAVPVRVRVAARRWRPQTLWGPPPWGWGDSGPWAACRRSASAGSASPAWAPWGASLCR